MEQFCYYRPYYNPAFESLIERINPPRVCIDNDSSKNCTLIKVDSANKHGILLEVVQILTDLDLYISKSYICSDGGWFMDVFHVTDQFGNKITDEALIQYIQKAVCTKRNSEEEQVCPGREVRPRHVVMEHTALEITMTDQPGLLSEVSAVLAELGCHVSAGVAWTHNHRGACIIYVDDQEMGRPITDQKRLSHIQEHLQTVVEAHHKNGEKQTVRWTIPAATQTHTERRLHQLMLADEDYTTCCNCGGSVFDAEGMKYERLHEMSCECTHVSIDTCKEKGYSVVNIRCRDRPKLLFDTVCALTDMQYMVFHAAISSNSPIAVQEYYVRRKDGCTLNTEKERRKVSQCLIAAVERRGTQGLKLDITAKDRTGLLSDVTRVFRENGLSVTRAEIGTRGEKATGTFYVTDASGLKISKEMVEAMEKEIGGTIVLHDKSLNKNRNYNDTNGKDDKPSLLSLGSFLWSRLERISGNFGPIWS
ncbi:ACT domain-containing protein ACR1-like [Chenopodium quinoa]|uniref:ACT domain-containing protein ACR n=1 Tax=Chenopodium quinoa TaxID=63459 RepID=A0A803KYB7_CHEQI|nr:ACT domain-containing protein ACR1-like [Chenopodium quinoa]